jgi:hypothetical protein
MSVWIIIFCTVSSNCDFNRFLKRFFLLLVTLPFFDDITVTSYWQNRVNKMEKNKTKTEHSKAQVKQIQTSRIKMAEQYKVKE